MFTLQKTPARCSRKNTIVRLQRKRDVNTPETRAKALVPRKRKTLDLFGKDSNNKMKKVHNTKSNSEEMITTPQKTIHPETGVKIPISSGTASPSTTGSTSLDWLEIIEDEAAAKNLQRELKVNDTPAKNSIGFNMEGSDNLCNSQLGEVISSDLHTGISKINIDAISDSNKKIRNHVLNKETKSQYKEFKELKNKQVTKEETLVPVQNIEAEKTENTSNNSNQKATVHETEVVEQDIQMDDMANLPETEEAHSSIYTERVETSVNVEPSITLSLASNKGNIAPVNLMANNRESARKVDNISHDQPNPKNSMNEDITQPKENNKFTEITYSKKKKKSNNIKKDKREHSGPYKKSKTLQ
ncbi:32538_t:CDS:2 [Gigaspora margarita]|uniref:32538_t:CDS:1 n=1 Tax=Gigaspora margarita TaxID=4874 RepID=A0ABN7VRZ6_GIGMA|nr:32538_t:CDS:2 [Gigaspora margarita]